MTIRPATAADYGPVSYLLRAAFGGPNEARLVEALRRDGAMARELVFAGEHEVVRAYLALVRMTEPQGWLALAPVAVAPGSQGLGLGGRLIHAALGVAEAPVVMYPAATRRSIHSGLRPRYYLFKMALNIPLNLLRMEP